MKITRSRIFPKMGGTGGGRGGYYLRQKRKKEKIEKKETKNERNKKNEEKIGKKSIFFRYYACVKDYFFLFKEKLSAFYNKLEIQGALRPSSI